MLPPAPGFWQAQIDDGDAMPLAVNLSERTESALAVLPEASSGGSSGRPPAQQIEAEEARVLWPLLLALALPLMVLESRLELR